MLRLYAVLFFVIIVFFPSALQSQCLIEGPRNGCVNDIITFALKPSSGVSSYNWNFGTYGNSSNAAPSIKITATGTVLVTCEATLSAGGTCKDTHLLKIHPNPIGKLDIDPSSNQCAKGNRICLKDASTKGAADIERITLLWYDGTIAKTTKPLALICRSFPGAGTYTYNLEVADDFGCKHSSIASVTVNPSPIIQGSYKTINYCDSISFCFEAGASGGGTSFMYSWVKNPTSPVVSTNNIFCKTLKAGENVTYKCRVTNNFGCADSVFFYGSAPLRNLSGKLSKHKFCRSEIEAKSGFFGASEFVNWTLNGIPAGTDDTLRLTSAVNGWNYVRAKQRLPCKGELYDSFFVTEVSARGIVYNSVREKVIDTTFFLDMSYSSPWAKILRTWSFNDQYGTPCTTDTKKNVNAWTNCNFSKDSLARHYYHHKECLTARLHLVDSISGCSSDTTFDVFRTDFCRPLIEPSTVCLGDPVVFRMSWPAWFMAGIKNTLYTDTHPPVTEYQLNPKQSLSHFYNSVGYKSPVFRRFYDSQVVWKDSSGIMVVDSIRTVGWVIDTFFNGVHVLYRPSADFTVTPPQTCPPWKVKLNFVDTSWSQPDTMIVSWGDTIEKFYGFKDSITPLVSLEHEYKKSGNYIITVQLIPKNGCISEKFAKVGMGMWVRFNPILTCNWRNACFKDTITNLATNEGWKPDEGSLKWDFGNGTTDTVRFPCVKYAKTGNYIVTLTATNKAGCSESYAKKIILAGPVAAIKKAPMIYCSEIHTFYDSSFISGDSFNDYIVSRQWNFGDGTPELSGTNPSHIYPSGGEYTVRLVIKTAKGCSDTVYEKLKVLGPEVLASIVSDTLGCPPLTVRFENHSKQSGNFIWQFGDSMNNIYSTRSDTAVTFTYKKSGVYFIKLIGGDSFYNPNTGSRYFCSAVYPKPGDTNLRVEVFPPAETDFTIPDSVCPAMVFEIKNTSAPKTAEYTWKIGGSVLSDVPFGSVYKHFDSMGTYAIGAFPEIDSTDKLCPDSMWKTLRVVQHKTRFVTDCQKSNAPFIYLSNLSAPASDIYRWTEMDPSDSSEKDLAYSRDINLQFHLDTGRHIVCLSSRDSAYCLVRSCTSLLVNNYIVLANVFTPGSDGFNDVFKVPLGGYTDYEFLVFNRYGERIFYSDKPGEYWNGKVNNSGSQLPSGTYFYQLFFQEECKEKRTEVNGSITLLR